MSYLRVSSSTLGYIVDDSPIGIRKRQIRVGSWIYHPLELSTKVYPDFHDAMTQREVSRSNNPGGPLYH